MLPNLYYTKIQYYITGSKFLSICATTTRIEKTKYYKFHNNSAARGGGGAVMIIFLLKYVPKETQYCHFV